MIDKALEVIVDEYNAFFLTRQGVATGEKRMILSPVITVDGKIATHAESLGLSLVNIVEDKNSNNPFVYNKADDDKVELVNSAVNLNVYVLIVANFSNYKEALKAVSSVILCFQAKSVFTTQNTPDMDASLQRLVMDLYTPDLQQQHYIWGMLGTHYMPSVMYRMRMLSLQSSVPLEKHTKGARVNTNLSWKK
ncbi:DUF4255 domain-containing protein [Maridesulfovibrio sp.]|uniref:DUF4255 domain-containing protein n=1 Tax=Maridesulfovibrio sp. TaxID=2795000 RepID=UPI0039F10C19